MTAPLPHQQCLVLPITGDADSLRVRRALIQLLPHLKLDRRQESRLVAVCYGLAEHSMKQNLPASMRLMLRAEQAPALRVEVRPNMDAEDGSSWPPVPAADLLESGLAALLEQFARVECRAARGGWLVALEQPLTSAVASVDLAELVSADCVSSSDPRAELRAASAAHLQGVAEAARLEQEARKHEGRSRQLQAELLETNQGVLALYSELEDHVAKLRDLNETLEQRVAERTAEAQQRAEQLRMLASELSQTEQRERKRLAQILHDHLQQLLVAARMSIGELRRRMGGQAPASGQGAAQIVERIDILLSESIEASRSLTVELSPPILHDAGLVPALHWLVRQQEEKHGLRVQIQTQADAEPDSEDMKVLLFQVVRELLFNTVKHAGVRDANVELTRRGDQLQIVVADDGAGFEISGLRQKPGGSFGLFSIRERLRLLGAEMSIDTGVGRGTRVTLVAPLRPAEQNTGAEAGAGAARDVAAQTEAGTSPKIRLLLADDHRSLRASFSRLLRHEADIELVGEAADGETTIEMAHRLHPDVVLMDVSMPRVGGIEATRQITRQLPQTRVIALSMHQDSETEDAMRAAGAAAYVLKDAPSNELLAAVRRCAGRAPNERQN